MMFHLALRAADLILQLPAGVFEGVVEGECEIRMPLIRRRSPFHIHLPAVRQRETDVDLVKPAGAVMLTGAFQHHPACSYTAPALLELRHVLRDGIFDYRSSGDALKFEFRRRLHVLLPFAKLKSRAVNRAYRGSLSGHGREDRTAHEGLEQRQFVDVPG
jgi:hypothetical protein